MAASTPRAREFRYADLDEMLADVEHLLTVGYEKHGNWTLGQAAGHVADWARFPIDGFPNPPLPLRAIFWLLRKTGRADKMARQIMADGFKSGLPTAPATVPAAEISDAEGVEKLREVIARIKSHTGQLQASPLFGAMDKDTHVQVTLLHAAHHFGYLTASS